MSNNQVPDNIRSSNRLISGVDIYNASHSLLVDSAGSLVVSGNSGTLSVDVINTLVPTAYDYVAMSPTGTNPTTIVYKIGGSGGITVATLTLTYDASNNVQTVAKT